jgi:hypothetical protein
VSRQLLSALGVLFVTLMALEVSLQGLYFATAGAPLFARVGAIPIHTPHRSSGFFNKPNLVFEHKTNEFQTLVVTNSAGLRVPARGVEYADEKPAGVTRVLLLGPSFAFGWGVDYAQTLAARLEEMLGVQVINAGVPALGALPQLKWYEDVGRRYEVDVVIQIIYGTMGVSRSFDDYTVDSRGYLRANHPTSLERAIAIGKRSGLLFYSWVLISKFSPSSAGIVGAGRQIPATHRFEEHDEDVQEGLSYYAEFRDAVRRSGATPLVLYTPLSYIVHTEDVPRLRHLGVREIPLQMEFDRAFCDLVTARALPCVNLTPTFIEAAASNPERLYYWLDIHWTPRGNEVAARATAAALERLGF